MTEDVPVTEQDSPDIGVLLPAEPAMPDIVDHGRERFLDVVAAHPESSLVWALLAEGALSQDTRDADVSAYAFARTGYHRGVEALRQAGWRGFEPIPWNHEPNQGFLRATWLLALAAERLGERDEVDRCVRLVRESSPDAYVILSESRPLASSAAPPIESEGEGSAEATDASPVEVDEQLPAAVDAPEPGSPDSADDAPSAGPDEADRPLE